MEGGASFNLDLSQIFNTISSTITDNWGTMVSIAAVLLAVPYVIKLFKRVAK